MRDGGVGECVWVWDPHCVRKAYPVGMGVGLVMCMAVTMDD